MNVVAPIWGQNIVAYGPGDSRLDHTPQEQIHIAEYAHAITVLELVLQDIAAQRELFSDRLSGARTPVRWRSGL